MANQKLKILIHTTVPLVIVFFYITLLNTKYPYVGHDYSYFIPRILDTYIHYRINGLSIQWYTPSWGGGLPAYPNPQQIQFSLPQLLTFIINPWGASVLSSIIFVLLGYFAMYLFTTRTLGWRWQTGILGAIFFIINGFYIEHMIVGHVNFQTFPLLPLITLALFSPSLPAVVSALVIALIMASVIYGAGFYIFVIFVLSLTVALPALYLHNNKIFNFRRFIFIILLAAIFFLLLAGSKILAVYSFMRFFPRQISDNYPISMLQGLLAIARQLLGVMGLIPLRMLRGQNVNTLRTYYNGAFKTDYGVWEFDIALTPMLWIFLAYGVLFHPYPRRHSFTTTFRNLGKWSAAGILLFAVWLVIEFTLAKGLIYPILQKLPILSSLHVNVRFASALIFPLAILGAYCSEKVIAKHAFLSKPIPFILIIVLALAPILFYFSFSKDLWQRWFILNSSLESYQKIRDGQIPTVKNIIDSHDLNLSPDSSNLYMFEPVFGYVNENFRPKVWPGPVDDVQNNYFNMTNPASLVFPEENHLLLFERINTADRSKLQDFINRRQPDWKRPLIQSLMDRVAEISIIIFSLILVYFLLKKCNNF
jgi:hypothetical protein